MIVEQVIRIPARETRDNAGRPFIEPERFQTVRLEVNVDELCRTLGTKATFARTRKAVALRGAIKVRAL